jgi:hypothetical protein
MLLFRSLPSCKKPLLNLIYQDRDRKQWTDNHDPWRHALEERSNALGAQDLPVAIAHARILAASLFGLYLQTRLYHIHL